MKIKYLGPSKSVNVEPYGPHVKNTTLDYPDDFGAELIASSKKQIFEVVEVPEAPEAPEAPEVPEAPILHIIKGKKGKK